MGITQVDLREAERFEEGIEPEFQDIEEELPKVPGDKPHSGHVSGASPGGYGSSSLQECLDMLNQARSNTPAPCHSKATNEESSNPPQFKTLMLLQLLHRPLGVRKVNLFIWIVALVLTRSQGFWFCEFLRNGMLSSKQVLLTVQLVTTVPTALPFLLQLKCSWL